VSINPNTNVAFIIFEEEDAAERAYIQCHNREIQGHHVFVDYAAGRGGGGGDRDRDRERDRDRDRG